MALDPLACNPFFVLELAPDCGPIEVERAGAKLMGLLELGIGGAATYPTPVGRQVRTIEAVREAVASLRDPNSRLYYELWASAASTESLAVSSGSASAPAAQTRVAWWKNG